MYSGAGRDNGFCSDLQLLLSGCYNIDRLVGGDINVTLSVRFVVQVCVHPGSHVIRSVEKQMLACYNGGQR